MKICTSPPGRLSRRTLALSAPGTSSMRSKANAMKESGIRIINFAAGELTFDACQYMKIGAIDAVNGARNRYTPPLGLPLLREKIANTVSQRCGIPVDASEIAVTAGAKQALFNAAMVLLNPGDEVIIPLPYWETLPTQIILAGAVPVFVDTRADNYHLSCNAVATALTPRTRMIVINTPNNPTGTVYQREQLTGIARLALEHQLWVVFDECYRTLLRTPHEHHNILSLVPELKSQTVLVDSFSKSLAVTGWRVGYACAPSDVVAAMHNLQGHTTSNPNSLAQYAALKTLSADTTAFTNEVNQFLDEQLQIACTHLNLVKGIRYAPAEGAFYLYIDISGKLGGRHSGSTIKDVDHLADLLLNEAHIAVVPGSGCGDPKSVRISYAVSRDELSEGLTRFAQFMSELVTA
ncbi:pyridoxal phosphate-dependent aminotransferase [Citrobacter werkmanii]|uniref:pyridoxal phosphate-dependent aminotransferase n=1 Tax=Citrobacter werkmanii TaxID=67827 RepID=UPI00264CF646|nr:pyridoxal phosphate-dependent aminotransferase [Citrobacter werkmanii]MDN8554991.1 pyridoxal phosphate-dependent aminotransferase [Citrobacter werkmanii]